MSETDMLLHLAKKLEERVRWHEEQLGAGAARDYSEYAKMVGSIKGLLAAKGIIMEISERYEQYD